LADHARTAEPRPGDSRVTSEPSTSTPQRPITASGRWIEAKCKLSRVARAKERGEAARDDGDDEDGPHLQADVDESAGRRQRVLDL
jgi:hypothetical protein